MKYIATDRRLVEQAEAKQLKSRHGDLKPSDEDMLVIVDLSEYLEKRGVDLLGTGPKHRDVRVSVWVFHTCLLIIGELYGRISMFVIIICRFKLWKGWYWHLLYFTIFQGWSHQNETFCQMTLWYVGKWCRLWRYDTKILCSFFSRESTPRRCFRAKRIAVFRENARGFGGLDTALRDVAPANKLALPTSTVSVSMGKVKVYLITS